VLKSLSDEVNYLRLIDVSNKQRLYEYISHLIQYLLDYYLKIYHKLNIITYVISTVLTVEERLRVIYTLQ